MPLVTRTPTPALRAHVRQYFGFSETTGARTTRREGPGADVVLLLTLDHEWRICSATDDRRRFARYDSVVGGLRDSSIITEHDGRALGLQVNLTPPGAFSLFGMPMSELADEIVPAELVLPTHARGLADRLAELPTWEARFELLDTTLPRLLGESRRPSPEVVWAWRRLHATAGRARIGDLVATLGWSRKRLAARFRSEIGLTPKTLARLLRFERAAALLRRDDRPPLAEVAFACGYYDQAHLTHEVRRITGVTPQTYAANFQDATPQPS
jgi:AraC-like DNA-binding protein